MTSVEYLKQGSLTDVLGREGETLSVARLVHMAGECCWRARMRRNVFSLSAVDVCSGHGARHELFTCVSTTYHASRPQITKPFGTFLLLLLLLCCSTPFVVVDVLFRWAMVTLSKSLISAWLAPYVISIAFSFYICSIVIYFYYFSVCHWKSNDFLWYISMDCTRRFLFILIIVIIVILIYTKKKPILKICDNWIWKRKSTMWTVFQGSGYTEKADVYRYSEEKNTICVCEEKINIVVDAALVWCCGSCVREDAWHRTLASRRPRYVVIERDIDTSDDLDVAAVV